jgi:uncharacterized membrane protein
MKTSAFLSTLEHDRIAAAIATAERATTGHIRVFVSHRSREDALAAAHARFCKLGLHKTDARNAVLVYFSPRARKYAVVGDEGIHQRGGGDAFWQSVVDATMAPLLKEGRFTDAIVAAVEAIGRELATHYPAAPGSRHDDVPDAVEEDS